MTLITAGSAITQFYKIHVSILAKIVRARVKYGHAAWRNLGPADSGGNRISQGKFSLPRQGSAEPFSFFGEALNKLKDRADYQHFSLNFAKTSQVAADLEHAHVLREIRLKRNGIHTECAVYGNCPSQLRDNSISI